MGLQEKIEKYTRGELHPEEQVAFEKELANNQQLADELSHYRKNELAIKAAARQQLRKQSEAVYREQLTKKGNRALLIQRMAIAAGFLLLLAAGILYFGNNKETISPDQLFAQYFEMPVAPGVRDGNLALNEKWAQAINFYSKADFESAIPLFTELITDNGFEQKETAKLLLGASLLAVNKPNEAYGIFEQIDGNSSFKEDAEWYAALALLKAGKTEAAKKALENMARKQRHYKKGEAVQLLKDL